MTRPKRSFSVLLSFAIGEIEDEVKSLLVVVFRIRGVFCIR